ncbi:hypothetical protein ACFQ2B_32200 [Streptomyces stramineus]|uniref:DivIVA domain-containing protein n=1 Tax=Streptomyces stramineus TaxID=173861 RepID=A0ABN1ATD8_9ACTN
MSRVESHPADNDPPARVALVVGQTKAVAAPETPPAPSPFVYDTPQFRSALRKAVTREFGRETEELEAFADALERLERFFVGTTATHDSYPSAGGTSPHPFPAEG